MFKTYSWPAHCFLWWDLLKTRKNIVLSWAFPLSISCRKKPIRVSGRVALGWVPWVYVICFEWASSGPEFNEDTAWFSLLLCPSHCIESLNARLCYNEKQTQKNLWSQLVFKKKREQYWKNNWFLRWSFRFQ